MAPKRERSSNFRINKKSLSLFLIAIVVILGSVLSAGVVQAATNYTITFNNTQDMEGVRVLVYNDSDYNVSVHEYPGLYTNGTGKDTINLTNGTYYYKAAKGGYFPLEDNFTVEGSDLTENITLEKSNYFVSTWNTSKDTGSNVALPLDSGGNYDFTVDWGDGNTSTVTSGDSVNKTHEYGSDGVYTINISGTIGGWRFNDEGDKNKILNISSWGPLNLGNNENYFHGCSNLNLSGVEDILNLSGTSNMFMAFNGGSSISKVQHMNEWDVSKVTHMPLFFINTQFNQDIGNWDVSNVETMSNMFRSSDFNQDISQWNVSSVYSMPYMFQDSLFNQDIGNWDVSNVEKMGGMFQNSNFNQDISGWDTSSVTDMSGMFFGAPFNQDIGSWDVSQVITIDHIFYDTSFNQNISKWNTSNINDMSYAFGSSPFNQNISSWDVSNVENMEFMFRYDDNFDQNLGSWNVSSVTEMRYMFQGAGLSSSNYDSTLVGWSELSLQENVTFDAGSSDYTKIGLQAKENITENYNWDISDGEIVGYTCNENNPPCTGNFSSDCYGVTNMESMFEGYGFSSDPDNVGNITNWDTGCITNMRSMFKDSNFNQNISNWNTSNVTNMRFMFTNGDFNQDISNWDVSQVTSMQSMFYSTPFNQDISSWDTSSVTDMSGMFVSTPFNYPLNSWNTSNVKTMFQMFRSSDFNQDISSWDTSSVTDMMTMFKNSLFDQDIGDWNVSNVDNMEGMFQGARLSAKNYDNLLAGWSNLTSLQENVTFDAGSSNFTYFGEKFKNQTLEDEYNWNITDGNKVEALKIMKYDTYEGINWRFIHDTEDSSISIDGGNWINVGNKTNYLPDLRGANDNYTIELKTTLFGENTNKSENIVAKWDTYIPSHGKPMLVIQSDDGKEEDYTKTRQIFNENDVKMTVGANIGYSLSDTSYLSINQMKAMIEEGHDIVSHTPWHEEFGSLDIEDASAGDTTLINPNDNAYHMSVSEEVQYLQDNYDLPGVEVRIWDDDNSEINYVVASDGHPNDVGTSDEINLSSPLQHDYTDGKIGLSVTQVERIVNITKTLYEENGLPVPKHLLLPWNSNPYTDEHLKVLEDHYHTISDGVTYDYDQQDTNFKIHNFSDLLNSVYLFRGHQQDGGNETKVENYLNKTKNEGGIAVDYGHQPDENDPLNFTINKAQEMGIEVTSITGAWAEYRHKLEDVYPAKNIDIGYPDEVDLQFKLRSLEGETETTVNFYNAETDELIGTDTVTDGDIAKTTWDIDPASTKKWYVETTSDGDTTNYTRTSETFVFNVNLPTSEEDSSSSTGGSYTPSLPSKTHSWLKLEAGEKGTTTEFDSEFGIKDISVKVKNAVENAGISVTKHNETSYGNQIKEGKVYQYLEINSENFGEELASAVINFRVEKSWLENNSVVKEDMIVSKYDEESEEWNELEINYNGSDEDYHYYTVAVEEFSLFAISEKVLVDSGDSGDEITGNETSDTGEETGETEQEKSYWYFWVLGIIIVGLIVWFVYNRNEKSGKLKK